MSDQLIRMNAPAAEAAREVQGLTAPELWAEFDSLLRHTEEDALDNGEMTRLGAVATELARRGRR